MSDNKLPEKKLTDWKKEPTVTELAKLHTAALPNHQNQIKKIKAWLELMEAKNLKNTGNKSSVVPKLIRKQAEWRYSALSEPFLSSDKLFQVTPATFEDAPGAEQNELVINWQFRTKMNRVKLMDDISRSVVDEGTTIARIGWERVAVDEKEQVPVYDYYPLAEEDEEQLIQMQEAIGLREEDPRGYDENVPEEIKAAIEYSEETGTPVYAVLVGYEEVTVEKLLVNRPTVEIMDPQNVIIDPTCGGNYDKALFTIVLFEASKFELLAQGDRYSNLDLVNWSNGDSTSDAEFSTNTPKDFSFDDTGKNKRVVHEYWGFHDINDDGNLVPIVSSWIGSVMIRMEESPFPDKKLPFVVVPYSPVKRELYGQPDAELLKDNQAILGATTRGMIDLLGKSANSQRGIQKGLLDTGNLRRFERGDDYFYNPTNHPERAIHTHKFPEIPGTAFSLLNMQHQEAESLTGVKSFSGGISGESYGNVATGIRGALDAAAMREMSIVRRLAHGMQEIGTKIIAMNAVFLSDEEVVRVTNRSFVKVKREELEGNFDLIVDISTAAIDNIKSEDLSFMLQTIGPNAGMEVTMMIMARIADLKRMPELAEELRTYDPQPTEQEQMMQQLEMKEAELKIALLESEINMNNARAAQYGATSNKIGVETQHEVDGTNHRRGLAHQKAQSKGNQNLELTKALLKGRKYDESQPDFDAAFGFKDVLQLEEDQEEFANSQQARENDPLGMGQQAMDPQQQPIV